MKAKWHICLFPRMLLYLDERNDVECSTVLDGIYILVLRYLYKVLRGKLALLEADIDTYSLQENISSVGFS